MQTALYRHWGEGGELLYVGISLNAIYRLSQHRDKRWWQDIRSVTIQNFESREAALRAEKIAIQSEGPLFNIVHAAPPLEFRSSGNPFFVSNGDLLFPLAAPVGTTLPQAPLGDAWMVTESANNFCGRRGPPEPLAQVVYYRNGKRRRGQHLWLKSQLERHMQRRTY